MAVKIIHPVDTYVEDFVTFNEMRDRCRRTYDAIIKAKVNEEDLKYMLRTTYKAGAEYGSDQHPRHLPRSIDEARTFYRRED